jgi:hypothetical protein
MGLGLAGWMVGLGSRLGRGSWLGLGRRLGLGPRVGLDLALELILFQALPALITIKSLGPRTTLPETPSPGESEQRRAALHFGSGFRNNVG